MIKYKNYTAAPKKSLAYTVATSPVLVGLSGVAYEPSRLGARAVIRSTAPERSPHKHKREAKNDPYQEALCGGKK